MIISELCWAMQIYHVYPLHSHQHPYPAGSAGRGVSPTLHWQDPKDCSRGSIKQHLYYLHTSRGDTRRGHKHKSDSCLTLSLFSMSAPWPTSSLTMFGLFLKTAICRGLQYDTGSAEQKQIFIYYTNFVMKILNFFPNKPYLGRPPRYVNGLLSISDDLFQHFLFFLTRLRERYLQSNDCGATSPV